jgi:hypothetical protein
MPRTPRRPTELAGKVFRAKDALDGGLLTKRQLQGGAWRRLFRGVYADADLPVDHGLKCIAAGLLLPEQAAIAGRSAAYLRGVTLATADDPVEVIVPWRHRFGPVAGLSIRFDKLLPDDVDDGKPRATTPERTVFDVALSRDLVEAVTMLDALAKAASCGRFT